MGVNLQAQRRRLRPLFFCVATLRKCCIMRDAILLRCHFVRLLFVRDHHGLHVSPASTVGRASLFTHPVAKWSNEGKWWGRGVPVGPSKRRPGAASIWPIRVTGTPASRAADCTAKRCKGAAVNTSS